MWPLTFRDDHDAAIHRIDALEHQLAEERNRARDRAEHDARVIAMLRRAAADRERYRVEPSPAVPAKLTEPAEPIDELDAGPLGGRGPAVSRSAVVFLLVLTGGVIGLALGVLL